MRTSDPRALSIGTTVSATTSEARRLIVTVTAWSLKSWPAIPSTNTIGRKTATVVSVEADIAAAISFVPSTTALARDPPPCFLRKIASRTTIELSTIIPIPRVSPPSDMRLSEIPIRYMTRNVAMIESGIEVAMMSVLAEVAQESEEHENGEETADERGVAHFVHRLADEVRLVEEDGHRVTRRELFLPFVDPLADHLGDGHRVGVALLVERDLDALLPVDARDLLALLRAHPHHGHVFQTDDPALVLLDDEVGDLLHRVELVHRADQELAVLASQRAAGEVHVGDAHHLADPVDRDPERGQPLLIDVDLDLVLETALDLRGGHAEDRLEIRFDLSLRETADLSEIVGPGEREAHDRVERGIEAENDRVLRFLREDQAIELFADLHREKVHVRAPVELEGHFGDAGTRDRVDVLETSQARRPPLRRGG